LTQASSESKCASGMAMLATPTNCHILEELRARVEEQQRVIAELSLKDLAVQKVVQREDAVREREAAVAKREEDVGRREAAIALREQMPGCDKTVQRTFMVEEDKKATWGEASTTPSVLKRALLCTPTPLRSSPRRIAAEGPREPQGGLGQPARRDDFYVEPFCEARPTESAAAPLWSPAAETPSQPASPSPNVEETEEAPTYQPVAPVVSLPVDATSQVQEAARAAMQHLDRARRLSASGGRSSRIEPPPSSGVSSRSGSREPSPPPAKGSAGSLTALFEQRSFEALAKQRQFEKDKSQAQRRRSAGSVGAITGRGGRGAEGGPLSAGAAANRGELPLQRGLASSSSASSLVGLGGGGGGRERRSSCGAAPKVSLSELMRRDDERLNGVAPRVSLKELLRQDEAARRQTSLSSGLVA